MATDPKRELLRHTLATLAYRAAKPLRDAPDGFATFRASPTCRTAGAILAHLGDLIDWSNTMMRGEPVWREEPPGAWDSGVARFFAALQALDASLATDAPLATTPEALFQGPIADALTHVGQLATLRRLAGAPVKGENYFQAEIVVGRVGPEQAEPRREFD